MAMILVLKIYSFQINTKSHRFSPSIQAITPPPPFLAGIRPSLFPKQFYAVQNPPLPKRASI
jgi:hypothetical protein